MTIYDTYNDLRDPDCDEDKAKPILGGSREYPYPRRCRTGRRKILHQKLGRGASISIYVPRDEAFSVVKSLQYFSPVTLRSLLNSCACSFHPDGDRRHQPRIPFHPDRVIEAAYERLHARLKDIEGAIDARNSDHKLSNMFRAGVRPYEFMKPYSSPGSRFRFRSRKSTTYTHYGVRITEYS
ncbi:probable lipoxygenase 8, chloroplastic [Typha latifolia]|uniref:probable lipoxygenase 8, chloroplastic n=1 Tax=Typha latifolia TaxID=4733 RepID=UPI003C2F67FF